MEQINHITLVGGDPVGYFTYLAKNLSLGVRARPELSKFPSSSCSELNAGLHFKGDDKNSIQGSYNLR